MLILCSEVRNVKVDCFSSAVGAFRGVPLAVRKSGLHLFYELKHDRSTDSKTSRTSYLNPNLAINSRLACESVLVVVVDDKETDRDKLTPASSTEFATA